MVRRHDVAVAVLVLQPLAVERGPAGGAADQEAAGAHVAGGPGEVADPLEAEHRVVDVERDHRHVVGAVGRGRGDPGGHGTGLVDPLLQDLAALVLLVEHQLVGILRPVELAHLAEDAELAEHALHAEGAQFVGHDRHHVLADLLVAQERVEDAHERHGGRDGALAGGRELGREGRQRRHLERGRLLPPRRQVAAQRLAPARAGSRAPASPPRTSGTGSSGSARRSAAGRSGRRTRAGASRPSSSADG